jgi:uncharacterized protein YndB with AHSA1/START domain
VPGLAVSTGPQLTTEIDIDATPARVWAVLADLNRYSSWNPFNLEAQGRAIVAPSCAYGCRHRAAGRSR